MGWTRTHRGPADERGQVLSSVVALAAVVAVVGGLLVLFGTWGDDHEADRSTSPSPAQPQSSSAGSGGPTGDPTGDPSIPASTLTAPTSTPTTAPTTAPSTPVRTPTRAPRASTNPTSAPVTSATTSTEPTGNPGGDQANRPPVEIYNNTTRRGMADRVADRLRTAGWTVSGVDNWRGKVVGSTVYYQPADRDDAEALASKLGLGRVKPALDNMRKGRLTVILTSDYAE